MAKPLATALGQEIKALRERAGLRQEDVARAASAMGLDWSRSSIAALETGRRDLSAGELLLLPLVLRLALGLDRLEVSDLLPGDRAMIEVAEGAHLSAGQLRRLLAGHASDVDPGLVVTADAAETAAAMVAVSLEHPLGAGEAERKAAARLNRPMIMILLASYRRWGRSLTDERDRRLAEAVSERAKPRTVQAIRGHITRALLDELGPDVVKMPKEISSPLLDELLQMAKQRPQKGQRRKGGKK